METWRVMNKIDRYIGIWQKALNNFDLGIW